MANIQNFAVTDGEDQTLTMTARDQSATVIDLTSASISWKVMGKSGGTVLTKTGTVLSASAGTFTIALSDADTSALKDGNYAHEAIVTVSSTSTKAVSGRLRVSGQRALVQASSLAAITGDPGSQYNTVADVNAATIRPDVLWVRTAGYYTVGDGGGALYKRVTSAPSHGAYITSNAAASYWTLAEQFPNVLQVGAVGNGTTDDQAKFQIAASYSANVIVPARSFLINSAVTGTTRWWIQKGADILGQSDVGNNSMPNTSRLGGRVFWFLDSSTRGGLVAGDSELWPETVRNPSLSLAELAGVSPTGQVGVFGATRTSDDPVANEAAIAICGLTNNDNAINPEAAWGMYLEPRRQSGAGPTFGLEAGPINLGTAVDLNPYTTIAGNAHTVAAWLTSGGGVGGAVKSSAAIGIHNNGATFNRGVVFINNSLDATLAEAVTMYAAMRLAWYDSSGLKSYHNDNGGILIAKSDTADAGIQYDIKRRSADGTTATANVYEIGRFNFYGYNSGDYLGAYIQALQRSNFSGGTARYSVDITAKNLAGTDMQVTLNGITDSAFTPFPSDTIACGSSTGRWSDVATQTVSLKSYTVATLPTGAAGKVAFASDGRKNGEGAGAGTGVMTFHDGTAWRACDTGATVAA